MKKKINVSQYLHFLQVEKEMYIGWNRFYPSIFIFNNSALELLDRIKANKPVTAEEEIHIAPFLEEFKKYKFIYEGDSDPSREDFLKMVRQKLEEPDRGAKDFYRQEEDYADLKIVNEECNLRCSYCVNEDTPPPKHSTGMKKKLPEKDRLRIINRCVDQFFARKIKNNVHEAKIFFNGGEILVDWKLIKKIVQRIKRKYPGMKIEYSINTNLALLTEEIARFFKRHHFKVHISIDGYREAHNKTRKYHNGKGSFDDVIEKVGLYRKINKKNSLPAFQGTIEYPDEFQPEEVYKMDKHGFVMARLAPNLLNVTEDDAVKKARLMGKFLELNSRHKEKFRVTELIFTRAKNKINQEAYRFSFNCQGLSALPKLGVEVNISTLSISHLCGFIPGTALPAEELQYDIYNPKLWEVSYQFIKDRMGIVLKECMDCPLVGICVGGCILSGLDTQNHLNKSACVYQREMWELYVKKAYQDRKKAKG